MPAKHKFAIADLAVGDEVMMYGGLVGKAAKPIAAGELLTPGNIHHQASPFHQQSEAFPLVPARCFAIATTALSRLSRSDGQVGTRNYWLVVPLVFCENKNIQVFKQAFEEELGSPLRNFTGNRSPNWRDSIGKEKAIRMDSPERACPGRSAPPTTSAAF